jgi:hypothetical protein
MDSTVSDTPGKTPTALYVEFTEQPLRTQRHRTKAWTQGKMWS